ncbi:hypothetical protein K466DRAFT_544656 [Polyporus arcularius HHB13444]|uniref:BTB domain-containing protein n=1 Tax=Polyporus arcularius HHB13444 TaxID=1314778 RepID=A0A5C3PUJ7_9APHY|nr:hypothetical protein K466DRAFT_544656 [Polyporus arcularius HHB13444]
MLTADADQAVHPLFSDGDLVLQSKDNTIFRLSQETLRRTSPWFRTMLALPQSPSGGELVEPILMDESADLLSGLFSIVSGIELLKHHDFDYLESLLRVAEKYEMPMVISTVRLALFSPFTNVPCPIRLYGIACRMSWENEAKLASTRTLGVDLLAPTALPALVALEAPHRDKLVALHRQRKDVLMESIDDVDLFYANQVGSACNFRDPEQDCTAIIDHGVWGAFKYALLRHLEYVPLREILNEGVYRMAELEKLGHAQCSECSRTLYDVGGTIQKLQRVVNELPKAIEWP